MSRMYIHILCPVKPFLKMTLKTELNMLRVSDNRPLPGKKSIEKSEDEIKEKITLKISENALRNIHEITGYIAYVKHQPLNAIKIGDKFFETFSRIEKNPFAYPECEEIPTKNKI